MGDNLFDQYKEDPRFLKIVKKIDIGADFISDLLNQLKQEYPLPKNQEYDFSLKNKTLRIIKKT